MVALLKCSEIGGPFCNPYLRGQWDAFLAAAGEGERRSQEKNRAGGCETCRRVGHGDGDGDGHGASLQDIACQISITDEITESLLHHLDRHLRDLARALGG